MEYYIYGLQCPIDNIIKYVGATKHLESRMKAHLTSDKSNIKKAEWVSFLQSQQLCPKVIILANAKSAEEANEREFEFMVKYSDTIFNKFHIPCRHCESVKEKNITLRVTEEFAKILKDYAKKRFMSQANLVEYLVKKEIEKERS